ncbi:hypothetical protein F183_A00480 [Bryobacterales bacterium F-183]|nr:hypothetical protein F183_A00480 [Bryobacterales bacterium F-183]
MSNLKIGTRLLIGFGIIVALAVVIGVYALVTQRRLQELSQRVDTRDMSIQQGIQELMASESQMRGAGESAMLAAFLRRDRVGDVSPLTTQREWSTYRDANLRKLAELQSSVGALENLSISVSRADGWRQLRQTLKDAEEALRIAGPMVEAQFAAINANNLPEAASRSEEVSKAVSNYRGKLTNIVQAMQAQVAVGRADMSALTDEARTSVFVVLLVTVTAAIILSTMIHRSIAAPLGEFTRLVEKVGQGDLSLTITSDRQDEIGELGRSLDKMVKGLRGVASQIGLVSESLNSATAEIFASSQQQAAATSEQAAAVQQANATMSQLAQSGAQIADRAKQVASAAEATSSASATGLQSVRNTTSTMDSIRQQAEAVAENVIALSEKTQTIGDIIASVNDIAEQSHLLALNASIQAAVAGEHGRSFAVVANEMKNLAAQSKQATIQIRSILSDIQKGITSSVMLTEEAVKRVDTGRQQASVADQAIRKLTESVEESIRAFQQIVGGSGQQQIGFEQVTHAFRNIGVASQQTATSTKQTEKAAANLSVLTQELRSAMSRYQL